MERRGRAARLTLNVDLGVPVAVKEDDSVCREEVDPLASRARREAEDE
jgi:hypothetical protein